MDSLSSAGPYLADMLWQPMPSGETLKAVLPNRRCSMIPRLAILRHNIHEDSAAGIFEKTDAFLQCAFELARFGDRADRLDLKALCNLGEIHVGILQANADAGVLGRTFPVNRDNVLVLLVVVIGAIVEHDHQERKLVVFDGP